MFPPQRRVPWHLFPARPAQSGGGQNPCRAGETSTWVSQNFHKGKGKVHSKVLFIYSELLFIKTKLLFLYSKLLFLLFPYPYGGFPRPMCDFSLTLMEVLACPLAVFPLPRAARPPPLKSAARWGEAETLCYLCAVAVACARAGQAREGIRSEPGTVPAAVFPVRLRGIRRHHPSHWLRAGKAGGGGISQKTCCDASWICACGTRAAIGLLHATGHIHAHTLGLAARNW